MCKVIGRTQNTDFRNTLNKQKTRNLKISNKKIALRNYFNYYNKFYYLNYFLIDQDKSFVLVVACIANLNALFVLQFSSICKNKKFKTKKNVNTKLYLHLSSNLKKIYFIYLSQ